MVHIDQTNFLKRKIKQKAWKHAVANIVVLHISRMWQTDIGRMDLPQL